jgi:hypothetical protein
MRMGQVISRSRLRKLSCEVSWREVCDLIIFTATLPAACTSSRFLPTGSHCADAHAAVFVSGAEPQERLSQLAAADEITRCGHGLSNTEIAPKNFGKKSCIIREFFPKLVR